MFGWLREKAWMITSAVSVVCTMIMLGTVIYLRMDRDKLYDQIHDPKTGYIAQLTSCHNNVANLEGGIKSQNDAIDRVRADGQARIDKAAQAVSDALENAKRSNARLDKLRQAPQGSTICDRYNDVDARYMEFLK